MVAFVHVGVLSDVLSDIRDWLDSGSELLSDLVDYVEPQPEGRDKGREEGFDEDGEDEDGEDGEDEGDEDESEDDEDDEDEGDEDEDDAFNAGFDAAISTAVRFCDDNPSGTATELLSYLRG